MPEIPHSSLTGTSLHEPKGVATATVGRVYVSDGAGSGVWTQWPTGYGLYHDSKVTPSVQTITSTASPLENDGAGSKTTEALLPRQIRGSGSLWDTTTDDITPIAAGDLYSLQVFFNVAAKTSTPNDVTFYLTDDGTGTPTSILAEQYADVTASAPFRVTFSVDFRATTDMVTNGGQLFLATDSNSIDIDEVEILITRVHGAGI
jgi:hypothetical protein